MAGSRAKVAAFYDAAQKKSSLNGCFFRYA